MADPTRRFKLPHNIRMFRVRNDHPEDMQVVPDVFRGFLDGCRRCKDADVYLPKYLTKPPPRGFRTECFYICDDGHVWTRGFNHAWPPQRDEAASD